MDKCALLFIQVLNNMLHKMLCLWAKLHKDQNAHKRQNRGKQSATKVKYESITKKE